MRSLLPLAALLVLAPISRVEACSCTNYPDFTRAFQESQSIFLGEVLAVRSAGPAHPTSVWVDFHVEASWKGGPPEYVSLLTADNDGLCGVHFNTTVRYLVYAFSPYGGAWDGVAEPGAIWTHSCWRTHETYAGDPDIALLVQTAASGSSWGRLKSLYR